MESFRPGVAGRLGLDDATLRRERAAHLLLGVRVRPDRPPGGAARLLDPVVQSYGGSRLGAGRCRRARARARAREPGGLLHGSLAVSGILLAPHRPRPDRRGPADRDLAPSTACSRCRRAGPSGPRPWSRRRPSATCSASACRGSIPPGRYLYLYVELPEVLDGLCRTLGLEAWLDDPRLGTMVGRHAHKAELIRVIGERLAARTAAEWEVRLRRGGRTVHAGPLGARDAGGSSSAHQRHARHRPASHAGTGPLLGVPIRPPARLARRWGRRPRSESTRMPFWREAGVSAAEIAPPARRRRTMKTSGGRVPCLTGAPGGS